MPIPDLPLEVLSHIISLLPPPFYPPPEPNPFLEHLNPTPPIPQTHHNIISTVSKTSTKLLEAARPWLWQDVDVRSGRGWLAVVNALTEEVVEELPASELLFGSGHNGVGIGREGSTSPVRDGIPVSANDAHQQTPTIEGMARYICTPSSSTYPNPYPVPTTFTSSGIQITIPQTYSYSPPQPSHPSMLLTPPASRNVSPAGYTFPSNKTDLPTKAQTQARLRGRSRSPRRSVGFDNEGISSVLDRSRSVSSGSPHSRLVRTASYGSPTPSATYSKLGSGIHRRSSLKSSRTRSEVEEDEGNEDEDEMDDVVHEMRSPISPRMIPLPVMDQDPAVEDEGKNNVNPELLPQPGPYIRHLNFTNFRTIGSRRTQDEAVRGRYVTGGRLEGVIKNAPNLVSLCMTEYVDSALTYPVVEELFFRGYRRPRAPRRLSTSRHSLSRARSLSVDPMSAGSTASTSQLDPPRPVYVPYEDETEEERWSRRAMFTPITALDLTGCVSGVFTQAMGELHDTWLGGDEDEGMYSDRGRGRSRHRLGETQSSTEDEEEWHLRQPIRAISKRTATFRSLRRLSLRACTSLEPAMIQSLVLACPTLTHLDLSNTRVPSSLLIALTEKCPRSLRLQSLSLARCPRLTPSAIVDFLVYCPATHNLIDLNLYVNPTQGNGIEGDDLKRFLSAPCIKSGKLRYLDISSTGLTSSHLHPDVFPPQPNLISLGLSHIPSLPLGAIADFLRVIAPNVEILTLTGSSTSSLNPSFSTLQIALELHSRLINPITTVPFSISTLSLQKGSTTQPDLRPGVTRLRVIELSSPIRRAMAEGGNAEWHVIRSKGGRGWYVDVSAGWTDPSHHEKGERGCNNGIGGGGGGGGAGGRQFVRHLPANNESRKWLLSLSQAEGRVGSGVGWHSRKMEVVKGFGMLGREEGLAGVGGFAWEES